MTAELSSTSRRSIWHPLAVAGVVTALAVGVVGVASAAGRPTWLALGLWICLGVIAGFATSGST